MLAWMIIFNYIPMTGLYMAFSDYKIAARDNKASAVPSIVAALKKRDEYRLRDRHLYFYRIITH